MLYAKILNNTVNRVVPDVVHYDDGRWWDFRGGLPTDAILWKILVVEPKPADTAAGTYVENYVIENSNPTLKWVFRAWTQIELDARLAEADRQTKIINVNNAVSNLRLWSQQAASTVISSGNTVTSLQTVVNRFGILCDRLADLIESRKII